MTDAIISAIFKQNRMMKAIIKFRSNILVLSLYIGLTIIFTYPLIANFSNEVVGTGGDVYQNLASINNQYRYFTSIGTLNSAWNMISHLRVEPTIINTLLNYFFRQPIAYNLYWFFSFIASSYGVYLLVKFLFSNLKFRNISTTISAFVAGFIYSFSSAHFAWSSFDGAHHIEWIPLTTLFILKFIKKPSLKHFIFSCLFFLFLIHGEPHFTAYYLIFLVPLLLFYLSKNRFVFKNRLFKRYSILALILGILLACWFYLPMMKISVSEYNYLDPGINQATKYSPDILSIIVPSSFHPLWSEYFSPMKESFTGNTTTYSNYLGFTALILFIFSFFYFKRTKIKEIYFWSFSAIGFFILSLGPFLHFLGIVNPKIPLPYLFLYKFAPFFENIRAVGRLWVIALLCFSVAIAFGMKFLLDSIPKNRKLYLFLISIFIIFLLSLEYISIPMKFSSLNYSPFYDQLRNETNDYKVVEIPGSTNYIADAKTKYYASIDQKSLISGLDPARSIPGKWDFQMNTPVLSEILYTFPKGKEIPRDIFNHDYSNIANSIFTYYDIPYIIIQKEFIGSEQDYIEQKDFSRLVEFIENNFEIDEIYEDDYIYAYKIKRELKADLVYLAIGDGWGDLITEDKSRKLLSDGNIQIYNISNKEQNLEVQLDINSYKNEFNTVDFYLNDEFLGNYFAYESTTPIELIIENVPVGESFLEIKLSNINKPEKSPRVYFKNISYQIIVDDIYQSSDFSILKNNDDKAILMTPLPSQFYLDDEVDQEIYNHPIISLQNFIIEDNNNIQKLLDGFPFINEFFRWPSQIKDELEYYRDIREIDYYEDNISNVLAENNIGYIYLNKFLIDTKEQEQLSQYLNTYIPNHDIIDGQKFMIYVINDTLANDSIPFFFGSGWDILENKSGISKRRKIKSSASILSYSNNENVIEVKFNARTCLNETTYGSVEINGIPNNSFMIQGTDYKEIRSTSRYPLEAGLNQFTINLFDPQEQSVTGSNTCPIWVSDISIYQKE